ncbi:MAG TPA: hypothetical protein PKL14_03270 [Holophaga sp.]|nr:hypothetical protein [Holophaga sp.]
MFHRQPMKAATHGFEPLANGAQTNAILGIRRATHPIVLDRDAKLICDDAQRTVPYLGAKPMLEAVLHQRQKQQRRQSEFSHGIRQLKPEIQALSKAGLFSIQKVLKQGEFFFQAPLIMFQGRQDFAQQSRKAANRLFSLGRLFRDQRCHGIQAIEKRVGTQLGSQGQGLGSGLGKRQLSGKLDLPA